MRGEQANTPQTLRLEAGAPAMDLSTVPDRHQPPSPFLDATQQPPECLSSLRLSVSRDLPFLSHEIYSSGNL